MRLNRPKLYRSIAVLFRAGLFFWVFGSGCSRSIDTGKIIFTGDIIRFLIRDNPGIFSNSFLDTSQVAVAGTDIAFSRNYVVRTQRACTVIVCDTFPPNCTDRSCIKCDTMVIDSCLVLNTSDTVTSPGGGTSIVPKTPPEAGVDLLDTLVGTLRITDSTGTGNRSFLLPVTKFGYFQKLDSDGKPNRGWYVMGATQTFVGVDRMLDSVQIVGLNSNRRTLVVRQSRNTNLEPLSDPQVFKVRTNPFQLKPQDSVEVRAWVKISTFDTVYVFCHINDFSAIRRIQLTEISPGEFFGGFKLSNESALNYQFRRLAVDAIARSTLTFGSFDNEIWGIIYQVYP